ncbi:MAG: flagellar motor switch protein FliG [Paracoccaceae bacterium]
MTAALPELATAPLTRQQKAAIVIGALGPEAAAPILEQLDEASLRGFAEGMAQLRRIEPEIVNATIAEFLDNLDRAGSTIRGGLSLAREMLGQHVDQPTLLRILDDVDVPSIHNVWKKLARVNEDALAEFLRREHPQTVAVVLSKLASDHAARILSRFEPDRARDVVLGITKTQNLDTKVIEAIGASVSRDFLAGQNAEGPRRNPAERIGAIMNFTAADIRSHVLEKIAETQPDFAEEIKRKMFTFEDIPARIEPRDVTAVVRAVEAEVLKRALGGAQETLPDAANFILSNISQRMAEQIREELKDQGRVRRKDAEDAQNEVILAIRGLLERGEIRLATPDEEA